MVADVGFELVGRDDELARLVQLIGALADGPAGVVVRGEAGIGKTALWRTAVEAAARTGVRVLTTRCTEAEMPLAFGALADLLEPAFREAADELSEPQARALAIALGLEAPPDEAPDQAMLPRAFLALLRILAAGSPLLVAVDDVQWLDPPSQRVLAFAIMRLGDAPVGILATQRDDAGDPLDLRRALDERFTEIQLRPMSVGALRHLIRTRLGVRVPRPMVARVHRASGGNPMFALEFAKIAASTDAPPAMPASLEAVVRERVTAIPPDVLPLLATVAAADRPTPALLGSVVEDAESLIDTASAEALIADADGVIRFAHPLLASAAYTAVSPGVRRTLHSRLAAATTDPEERGRHIALATRRPDAAAATLLDEAARHAASRGAPEAAAELGREAVRLTPGSDVDEHVDRTLAVARFLVDAGNDTAGATVLDTLLASGISGPRRAEALLLRYVAEHDAEIAGRFVEQALAHAHGDDLLHARVLIRLSVHAWYLDDLETSMRMARRALVEAEALGEPGLLAATLALVARRAAVAGFPEPALVEQARALAAEYGSTPHTLTTFAELAFERLLDGDLPGARELLNAELRPIPGLENPSSRWVETLVSLELQAGNWEVAERDLQAAEDLMLDDSPWAESVFLSQTALVAALRGRVDDARRLAAEALGRSESFHVPSLVARNRSLLGFLELSLGDPEAGWRALFDPPAAVDLHLPIYPGFPDPMVEGIEALVALGRLDDAVALLKQLEARRHNQRWAEPGVLRSRALVHLGLGDSEAALASAEEAAVAARDVEFPLDRGRALLVAGEALRRLGERRRAAEKLEAATAAFSDLGARLWSARAEQELRRASPRPRRDRELTGAERRVAALVAEGRTNREVAAQVFTTVGTVEVHLTRIYRKLGLRSRTELARLVADGSLELTDD